MEGAGEGVLAVWADAEVDDALLRAGACNRVTLATYVVLF